MSQTSSPRNGQADLPANSSSGDLHQIADRFRTAMGYLPQSLADAQGLLVPFKQPTHVRIFRIVRKSDDQLQNFRPGVNDVLAPSEAEEYSCWKVDTALLSVDVQEQRSDSVRAASGTRRILLLPLPLLNELTVTARDGAEVVLAQAGAGSKSKFELSMKEAEAEGKVEDKGDVDPDDLATALREGNISASWQAVLHLEHHYHQ
ncbi:hypothetical protein CPB84DRAFT_1751777 [Gymnopilus junonius]|uniref:Uncharacterized protein n=1 Tax=Gymnopilus junonius TaxID=109634 RepID=A0A9P5TI46_GYMJU|nr:hypothetical protein CPB84DRAFT_1751777 [Gymnopilus junonius]